LRRCFRAAGGVVPRPSDAIINDIAFISFVARTMIPAGPQFEVAVVHHTGWLPDWLPEI
jgi:hypothetical protein